MICRRRKRRSEPNAPGVGYELLDVFVADNDLEQAEAQGRTKPVGGGIDLDEALGEPGDDEDEVEWEEKTIQRLFDQSKYVVQGNYGIDVITHCCLEPHGTHFTGKATN